MDIVTDAVFSVCVFIYHNIEQLENTIKSIYKQMYVSIELIISDDGSISSKDVQLEKIKSVIKPYQDRFENVILNVNQNNMGTVKHINKILPMTTGKYLCLLGSGDCLYKDDTLIMVAEYLTNEKYEVCFSKRILKLNEEKQIVLPEKRIIKAFYQKGDSLLNLCCREVNYITTIGSFFTRALLERYNGFDENFILLEDAPFFLKLLFARTEIGFIDEITCIHEKGGISNQRKTNEILKKDSLKTLTEIKYPRRNELRWFSRRVVIFKYNMRNSRKTFSKLCALIFYPDAALFLVLLVVRDWLVRVRFIKN